MTTLRQLLLACAAATALVAGAAAPATAVASPASHAQQAEGGVTGDVQPLDRHVDGGKG